MKYLILLTVISCADSAPQDTKCQRYKLNSSFDFNNVSYCYGIMDYLDLVCTYSDGSSYCSSKTTYIYKIDWFEYLTGRGELYEFVGNKEVLTNFVTIENNKIVFRRVDNNESTSYCTITSNEMTSCN
jgi:hypothetical protein